MTLVSELLTLKIENLRLKLQALQQMGQQLQAEQAALVEQARAEVQAPIGHLFNTETRTFQAPSGPAPLSTAPVRHMKRAKAS